MLASEGSDFDDEGGDAPRRPAPDPDDRLWRHPSEAASLPDPRRPRRSRRAQGAAQRGGLGRQLVGAFLVVGVAGMAAVLVFNGLLAGHPGKASLLASQGSRPPDGAHPATVAGAARGSRATPIIAVGSAVNAMVTNLLPGIVAVDVAGPGRQVRGTGLVLRSDGMILTTSALVSDANTITVTASDGREWNANLVGTDPATGAAVISVPAAGLKVLPLGTDDTLAAGQLSVSVSAPSQAGADPRVAIDLVSGVDQQVDLGGGSSLMDAIVTNSAPPDPMGSVILDSEGRVVGILQSVLTVGGAAHGVATPIAVLQAAAESLVAGQQVVHAWLGVTGSQPPRSQVNAPGQASATPSPGALVDQVAPASPAATAGLRPGDVITAVDGHPVASMAALDGDLGSLQPGTTVILTVERGRSFLSTAVTLDGQPGSAP